MKIIQKFLLGLLIMWPVYAQSQPIQQTIEIKSENHTKNYKKDQNITKAINKNCNTAITPLLLPHTTVNSNQEAEGYNHQTKEQTTEFWPPFFGIRLKITETLLVFFTGLMFVATLCLWLATRRLVIGAEKTASQQLRAYVFMKLEDGAKMFYDDKGCLTAPLIIKNFGKTPAYEFISWLYIGLYKFPLDTTLEQPSYVPTASKAPIAPSDIFRQYAILPAPLNKTEIEALRNKTAAIFVCGEVIYFDAFKIKQRSNLCLYSTGEDFIRGELAYYHEGNEAT